MQFMLNNFRHQWDNIINNHTFFFSHFSNLINTHKYYLVTKVTQLKPNTQESTVTRQQRFNKTPEIKKEHSNSSNSKRGQRKLYQTYNREDNHSSRSNIEGRSRKSWPKQPVCSVTRRRVGLTRRESGDRSLGNNRWAPGTSFGVDSEMNRQPKATDPNKTKSSACWQKRRG